MTPPLTDVCVCYPGTCVYTRITAVVGTSVCRILQILESNALKNPLKVSKFWFRLNKRSEDLSLGWIL